jgi:MFS superfamily sulfate permease-like transporter
MVEPKPRAGWVELNPFSGSMPNWSKQATHRPVASLPVISALILLSVFSMTTWREIPRLTQAPRSEAIAWAVIALLTIITDLSIAVGLGMFIGMFLHARKLQQLAVGRLAERHHTTVKPHKG